ncbi:MAG: hypothetical protein ACNA7V_11105, partial [Bacteroidales bacterium]
MTEKLSNRKDEQAEAITIDEVLQEESKLFDNSQTTALPVKKVKLFKSLLQIVADISLLPLIFLGGIVLKMMRTRYFAGFPLSKKLLLKIGVFPVTDHYYEPLFNPKYIRHRLGKDRFLPSIDLNIQEQLALLEQFNYSGELKELPLEKSTNLEYYYNN